MSTDSRPSPEEMALLAALVASNTLEAVRSRALRTAGALGEAPRSQVGSVLL